VSYDALGRNISKTDQAGKTTQFAYDALSRLTSVTDALNQVTSYGYDELGNQLTQTDALNRVTRFEYDKLGRRVKRTLPLGQVETYSYNTAGNLSSRKDFKGKTTIYSYDSMNRLLSKTPDATLAEPTISFTYNALGQRLTMSDSSGVTTYGYDSRNRLTSKATPQGTLAYTYDNASNLLTMRSSNANGASADYSYDVLNRLSSVTGNAAGARAATGATSMSYDVVGNLASYTYPNSVTTSYTYNSLNRLTNVASTKGATNLASFAYTLGEAGNRTSVTEQNGRVVNYSYDSLYRLTQEQITSDPVAANNGTIGYTYDAVGNRLNRTSTIAAVPTTTSVVDANDRLTSDAYDANGNTITSSGNGYLYDFENRLLKLNAGTPQEVRFVYDGDGNRVAKMVGSGASATTTKFLVDANNPTGYAQVVEEITTGAVQRVYVYGPSRISQQQLISSNWQVSFYGYDGHGSVRYLTDASGAITDRYDYDAFGVLIHQTGSTPNSYLYAGEQFDSSLGFYYNRARYLNTATGRFWTMDSFSGRRFDPISLHKYLYADASPINNADPSGLETAVGALGGAMGGVTINAMAVLKFLAIGAIVATSACALDWIGTAILREEGFEVKGLTPCSRDEGPKITLYRGVNEKHTAYADALLGTAKPNRRWWQFWKSSPATPYEHNTVQDATLSSVFTSWSRNPLVAENYALRDQNIGAMISSGVILQAEIPISRTYPSPDLHKVLHITKGIELPEDEVLVRGVIRGAKVTRVP
jgi:RHS repeat-associated protein